MQPRIFISRAQDATSIFYQSVKKELPDSTIQGTSLLLFTPLAFTLPDSFDGCFFYSRKGVDFFINQLSDPTTILRNKFIGAFGISTADALIQHGFRPTIIGDGNPAALAPAIIRAHAGKRILFPQAATSQNSLQKYLADHLDYFPLKVYSNQPHSVKVGDDFDVLVFTSPMNAQSFAQSNALAAKVIVAIGHTTAAALESWTTNQIIVAAKPYEKEMAEAVINALKK